MQNMNMNMNNPTEEDVMQRAQEVDSMKDEAYQAAAPVGEYTERGVRALAEAVNSIMPLFGGETIDFPTRAEDSSLPLEFMRPLTMIQTAIQDSGMDDYNFVIDSMTDDDALIEVAGKISALANNSQFKAFLKQNKKTQPKETSMKPSMEEAPSEEKPSKMDIDNLLMSRA